MAYLKKIANRYCILLAKFMIHSVKRSVKYLINAYELSMHVKLTELKVFEWHEPQSFLQNVSQRKAIS